VRASTAPVSPAEMGDRRRVVEAGLRALGRPRSADRVPPPEGRLSADERPAGGLGVVLASLGPVFADFGRYLSTRIDLLPRRDCLELAHAVAADPRRDRGELEAHREDAAAALDRVGALVRDLHDLDPTPRSVNRWTRHHDAWLAPAVPVAVRVVRPDAERLFRTDRPLLSLVGPWLALGPQALAAAIEDFAVTVELRLDQARQAATLVTLAEDARAGGTLDAPVVYLDHSGPGALTTGRVGGVGIGDVIDRRSLARRLASAWIRQAVSGQVLPFDFDLHDVRLVDGRLVLAGGLLEPQTADDRAGFLRYLAAAAADDPDAAWDWIAEAAVPGPGAESKVRLRSRLRQAVPFRDGESSGDDRLAERILVHWRAVREAGWAFTRHDLRLFRAVQAVSAATSALAPDEDALLTALQDERLRTGLADVRRLVDPRTIAPDGLVQDLLRLPKQLDELLTMAAEGRLRVKLHIADAEEARKARNRTVALVASLVATAGIAFLVRHLAPALGPDVERIGAVLLLAVGGWLLVAAARL